MIITELAESGLKVLEVCQGTSGTYRAFSEMRNYPPVLQNSVRRLSAVGPYPCTERLLVAIKQVNGSLPEPTAIPQHDGDWYRSPARLTSLRRY